MSDVELLARLIKCEAGGEGDIGMAAVATVIMNRVNTILGEYGRYNELREVAYAPRQFECVTGNNGIQNIFSLTPDPINYQIAQWAINGGKLGMVGDSLWFFNPFQSYCPANFPTKVGSFNVRIGDHCFYNPTSSYQLT